jgi:hypothetical protein
MDYRKRHFYSAWCSITSYLSWMSRWDDGVGYGLAIQAVNECPHICRRSIIVNDVHTNADYSLVDKPTIMYGVQSEGRV